MDDNFEVNLLRMIAASIYFQNGLVASREMFGRSYFSLGDAERTAVDQLVLGQVGGNYNVLTPDFLEAQQARQPMGFPIHNVAPTPGSSTP